MWRERLGVLRWVSSLEVDKKEEVSQGRTGRNVSRFDVEEKGKTLENWNRKNKRFLQVCLEDSGCDGLRGFLMLILSF